MVGGVNCDFHRSVYVACMRSIVVQRFIGLMMAPGLCGSASLARW